MTKIIVFGNEKGGSGKTTTAMHIMAYLLLKNESVGVIDLDIRQKSLFRFLENREAYSNQMGVELSLPKRGFIIESVNDSKNLAYQEEEEMLDSCIQELKSKCTYILIDCPGANTNFAILAHKRADLIISPINDSLIDFDLLGRINTRSKKITNVSIYSEMIWNTRKHRIVLNLPSSKWFVLRNRMAHVNSKNKKQLETSLIELSKRIGFRILPGFSERTIYRELFVSGLTLLDVSIIKDWKFTLSHISARNEIRSLMSGLEMS